MQTVTADILKQWLDNDEAVLIDVREPNEYAISHIPQARSLPLSQLEQSLAYVPAGCKVVVQCQKGKRGEKGCAIIETHAPHHALYNLEGGIEAWQQAGLPLISAGNTQKLPIMRQVQLAAGSLVALFSLLSLAGAHGFSVLTLLIGCGLIFAGATGWCGMAILLQKMPWNK
ncbi:rhodanese-like domain-containing protein [Pasteurellaceae bacterium HPA106]|uniref:rhodanese-like domain-containing protein n=1 Tax=Spirabiliibacterium pneumoniae TaxID=221400 RepID=UPI001AAD2E9E|nr:rhodanese-like domain-containing protein [Spirabiliibacterium pneumoniae]MBE2895963.1 rhodanese-like domain-containing protein [Spirabiliibacterium pneumoniae]